MQIIETSANQFYRVNEHDDPAFSHVYLGIAVKKVRGVWVKKANAREEIVRKAATRIVQVA